MGKQLDSKQRQEIAKLLQEGKNFREIAEVLKVDRTTILREINRNVGDNGVYDPELAQQKYRHRKRFPKLTPAVVASLPSAIREDIDKVLVYETPTVQRRQLVIDKYINEYSSLILSNLITPKAAMRALAKEYYMDESTVYKLLKREGVYKDRYNPVCILPKKTSNLRF